MSEIGLSQGILAYIQKKSYPEHGAGIRQHWLALKAQREEPIMNLQELLAELNPSYPFFCCRPAQGMDKIDFDFGPKKPLSLPVALYCSIYGEIVYSTDGQVVSASAGQGIITPPFIWEGRGHYAVDSDKVFNLPPEHPAAKVNLLTHTVLNPAGLSFVEDNVFLLSLVTNENTLNQALLNHLKIAQ